MAQENKRCPYCGEALPEGFSYCPSCTMIRDGSVDAPDGPAHSRHFALRRNIVLITAALVVVALVILLPRFSAGSASAGSSKSAKPQEVPVTAETKDEADETSETETDPERETTDEPGETDPRDQGATVDNVLMVPGENGHNHMYIRIETKKATCTAEGLYTFTCSSCGDSYTEVIPLAAHTWRNATCTAPRTCSVCLLTFGTPLGHDLDENEVCRRCGYNAKKEGEIQAENDRYEKQKSDIEDRYQSEINRIQGEINDITARIDELDNIIDRDKKLLNDPGIAGDMQETERLTNEINKAKEEHDAAVNNCEVKLKEKSNKEAERDAALSALEEEHKNNLKAIEAKY